MHLTDQGEWLICFHHDGIWANINGEVRNYTNPIPFGFVNDGMWHYLGASWSSDGHFFAYFDNVFIEENDYQPGARLPEL